MKYQAKYWTLRRLQTSQTGLLHSNTPVNDTISANLAVKTPADREVLREAKFESYFSEGQKFKI